MENNIYIVAQQYFDIDMITEDPTCETVFKLEHKIDRFFTNKRDADAYCDYMNTKTISFEYIVLELSKDDKDYVPDLMNELDVKEKMIINYCDDMINKRKEIKAKYKQKYENYNELFCDTSIMNKVHKESVKD